MKISSNNMAAKLAPSQHPARGSADHQHQPSSNPILLSLPHPIYQGFLSETKALPTTMRYLSS